MTEPSVTRRTVIRAGSGFGAGTVLIGASGSASAQSSYGGWLDDVGNYDGTAADETDADRTTVGVGAEGNGGSFAFDPPAVQVTPGTTVVWEWVAGSHDVVDEEGAYESERTSESGFTFEWTPESTGVSKYYCTPHRSMGMKGVVDVVEGGGAGGSAGQSTASGASGDPTDAMGSTGAGGIGGLAVTALVAAFLSPALFAAVRRNRGGGRDEHGE